MAERHLKSIKFPGLPYTYTIPEIDSTLSIEGMAADAKQIGELINNLTHRLDALANSSSRVIDIYLPADGWIERNNYYYQEFNNIYGITPYSQVNLMPSIDQLAIFHDKDIAFVTENENGVVTVYVLGDRPNNDYTIQATVIEVAAVVEVEV